MYKLVAALIVKNEEAVLARCLTSIEPHVYEIVVNDNGSTDDTPRIMNAFDVMRVPGDWIDFSTNRNLVLNTARGFGDYVLCGIDADEELVVPEGFVWPELTADAYSIDIHLQGLVYPRVAIVRSAHPWEWRYPIHEGLYSKTAASVGHIEGIYIESYRDQGARSKDPDTQKKDLAVIEGYLNEHPDDPRMTFYHAQQLRFMGKFDAAISAYTKRRGIGVFEAERWYSQYMIGRCIDAAGKDPVTEYIAAYRMDPWRAEPLYHLADWCRRNELHVEAFMYAHTGALLPRPANGFFVEHDVYEWRLLDVMTAVAWYTPFKMIGGAAIQLLLTRQVPQEHMARVLQNHLFYNEATRLNT